jgi:hypothetical protein
MGSGGLPRLPGLKHALEDDGKQGKEQFLHGTGPLIDGGHWLDTKHTCYLSGNGFCEVGQSPPQPFAANDWVAQIKPTGKKDEPWLTSPRLHTMPAPWPRPPTPRGENRRRTRSAVFDAHIRWRRARSPARPIFG